MIEVISFVPNNLETISRGADVSDKITVCEKNPLPLNPVPAVAAFFSSSLVEESLFPTLVIKGH